MPSVPSLQEGSPGRRTVEKVEVDVPLLGHFFPDGEEGGAGLAERVLRAGGEDGGNGCPRTRQPPHLPLEVVPVSDAGNRQNRGEAGAGSAGVFLEEPEGTGEVVGGGAGAGGDGDDQGGGGERGRGPVVVDLGGEALAAGGSSFGGASLRNEESSSLVRTCEPCRRLLSDSVLRREVLLVLCMGKLDENHPQSESPPQVAGWVRLEVPGKLPRVVSEVNVAVVGDGSQS